MPRLLLAQKVAGAANIEIVARQSEAGAERIERLQDLEPLLCGLGEGAVGWSRQQRIGALLGAAYAAAKLIKLSQAEHVGAMDDERVCGRYVETRFNDRG